MVDVGRGVIAGAVGTAVMSLFMLANARLAAFPNADIIGIIATEIGGARGLAWVVHGTVGSLWWGPIYALTAPILFGPAWARGLLLGLTAWVLMMGSIMPVLGYGFFGQRLGAELPLVTAVLHAVFGLALGGTYGSFGWRRG